MRSGEEPAPDRRADRPGLLTSLAAGGGRGSVHWPSSRPRVRVAYPFTAPDVSPRMNIRCIER